MNGTVKQFLDALEEMREVYPFENEKTRIVTYDIVTPFKNDWLQVSTIDEKTGIRICMSKHIEVQNERIKAMYCANTGENRIYA